MKYHSELKRDNILYSTAISNIESYNDILYIYDIIRYNYNFTPLNEQGFEKMIYSSLYCITNDEENTNTMLYEYYIGFLRRYLELNNLFFKKCIKEYLTEKNINILNISSFNDIKKISYNIFSDPIQTPIDNIYLPQIFKINLLKKYDKNIKILCKRIILEDKESIKINE